MNVSQAATWVISMYSLGLWASRMSPGPQMTEGMPASWKRPASVP